MSENLFEDIKKHKPYLVSNNGSGFYNSLFTYLEIWAGKYNEISLDNFLGDSELSNSEKAKISEYSNIKAEFDKGIPYDTIKLGELSRSLHTLLSDTIIAYKTSKTIKLIDSLFTNNKADLLKLKIQSNDPEEKRIILEAVLNTTNTKWCRQLLKSNYEENLNKLASIEGIIKEEKSFISDKNIGKPIVEMTFGAKLYKVDNVNAKEILSNIKTAFNGKALILDFWATWCAPCIKEMPYSRKLYDELKNEPLEFVYLCTSTNSDLEKWKSKIVELEIGGTHLFVESSVENELMNMFSLVGFPSYAFIDKNGNYKAGAISRISNLKKDELKNLIEKENTFEDLK